jgi:GT2 family glycosyltransferase
MGLRREVLQAVGDFDGTLRTGADEMDFFFRAKRARIEVAFAPDAIVAYQLRSSLRGCAKQSFRNAVAHAQLDAKNRASGAIAKQSTRSRCAALWTHLRRLGSIALLFSRLGRWRYAQGVGNAAGAVAGFVHYRQLVV